MLSTAAEGKSVLARFSSKGWRVTLSRLLVRMAYDIYQ